MDPTVIRMCGCDIMTSTLMCNYDAPIKKGSLDTEVCVEGSPRDNLQED